jgi:hypothetical protein
MFSAPVMPASARILPALTAHHCGAKPWSEETNDVVFVPISSRPSVSVSSASAYAERMYVSRASTRPSFVPSPFTSSKYGFGRFSMSVWVSSPRNWCWNSSVTGFPSSKTCGRTPSSPKM